MLLVWVKIYYSWNKLTNWDFLSNFVSSQTISYWLLLSEIYSTWGWFFIVLQDLPPFFHQYTPLCILSSKAGLIRYISHLGRAHGILSVLACFYQTDVLCMIQLWCFSPWISEFPVRNVNIHTRCWFVFMYNHMKILEHITNGKLKKSLEHLQCLYKCRMQGTKHIHIH